MDLFEQIKTFKTIVEFGSFSEASRQLGISLSAVSRQLENLEQQIGIPLLRRTTRRLHLTDGGRTYYQESARLLRDIEELHRMLKEQQAQPQGLLRVTVSNLLGHLKLTPIIPEFLKLYPKIHLEIEYSDRVVDIIDDGFDVALRSGPLADSSFVAMKLGRNKNVLCASPSYLFGKKKLKTIEDLSSHDIISFREGLSTAAWFFRKEDKPWKELKMRGHISVNQGLEYKSLVKAGLGIGLLYQWMIRDELNSGELVQVLPKIEVSYSREEISEVFALYSKDRFHSPKLKAFLDFLKQKIDLN